MYPTKVIQFHRHSRSGIYTVLWYHDTRIGWQTTHDSGVCNVEDFKCVHGGLKRVCIVNQAFETVMHQTIARQMYSLASQYTVDQLRTRFGTGTNNSNIGIHYYLTKLQLI